MKRISLLFIILLTTLCASSQSIRIISYNVENLFDTRHDTLKNDYAFLPDGDYHWTYERYKTKLINLSRVISTIGEAQTPVLVGLCEVENQKCLRDLLIYGGLRKYGYQFIHQESPDQRGIDCALLYNSKMFNLIDAESVPVQMPEGERPTRDIIYAKGVVNQKDTLHVFLCHFPSQLGGTQATAHKRAAARGVLQQVINRIYMEDKNANILVMGDMNAKPEDYLTGMTNLMLSFEEQHVGSHKWEGEWSCLDQFFVSPALKNKVQPHIYGPDWLQEDDLKYGGKQPRRSYKGFSFDEGGFSDHLPIYIDINF